MQKKGEKDLYLEGLQEISWLQNGKRPLTSSAEVTLPFAKKKTANV